MKKRLLKTIFKMLTITFLVVVVIGLIILNYAASDIASPNPSEIPTGSAKVLKDPAASNLSIQEFTCLDGKVPTLVIEPDTTKPLSKKASTIREQLAQLDGRDQSLELAPHGKILGTIVILHGRNGRKEHGIGIAERFCAVGLRCILLDLPSHGESPVEHVQFGNTDWEREIPYKVLTECASKLGFSTENVALWGMSMGGSFANAAASHPVHGMMWDSLTIVCSFDSLDNVIQKKCKFGWLTSLTSKLCQMHGGPDFAEVRPVDWAKKISQPVLVAHGDQDNLIPLARGKVLYESYTSEKKKWLTVKDGNHNNILITPMPLYAEMAHWVLENFE